MAVRIIRDQISKTELYDQITFNYNNVVKVEKVESVIEGPSIVSCYLEITPEFFLLWWYLYVTLIWLLKMNSYNSNVNELFGR